MWTGLFEPSLVSAGAIFVCLMSNLNPLAFGNNSLGKTVLQSVWC